jgi:lipopolysaccharide/colanic/teichoic acid biosynthesis glycosyltransferase
MKRLLDVVVAAVGLTLGSVIVVPAMIAVWLQDWYSPFYIAPRMGKGSVPFRMVKLRSMKVLADKSGLLSTAGNDPRVTAVGRFVRRWKLDEFTQLWNVLKGDMSLVGPRPQVIPEVALYTAEERQMLTVRPGITDLASIVFADEGEILRGASDPDQRYNQLIRPWKSRLALLYVRDGQPVTTDLRLLWLTVLTIVARPRALAGAAALIRELGGTEELARIALRREPLRAAPPPGATEIVGMPGSGAAAQVD